MNVISTLFDSKKVKSSKITSSRKPSLFKLLCCSTVLTFFLLANLLGVPVQQSLLKSLQPSLAKDNVEVRLSWSGADKAPGSAVLAPLDGFPINRGLVKKTSSFGQLFEAGAFHDAALMAVGPNHTRTPLKPREFLKHWEIASPEKRVFLSFTRDDVEVAVKVRNALEAEGYFCFTYLEGVESQPWANSVQVGKFFRESGVQLVIDSPAARKSEGVQREALALIYKKGGWDPPIVKPVVDRQPGSVPCCRLCTVKEPGHIIVDCGPRQCGEQCIGAEKP